MLEDPRGHLIPQAAVMDAGPPLATHPPARAITDEELDGGRPGGAW